MGWALVNSFVRLMETVMPCSSSIGPIQVFNLDQVKHNFTTKFYLLNHVRIENLFEPVQSNMDWSKIVLDLQKDKALDCLV